jgi:hypothetical protein
MEPARAASAEKADPASPWAHRDDGIDPRDLPSHSAPLRTSMHLVPVRPKDRRVATYIALSIGVVASAGLGAIVVTTAMEEAPPTEPAPVAVPPSTASAPSATATPESSARE